MPELTWQQKAQAILALVDPGNFNLRVRDNGTWYVNAGIERKEGSCLAGGLIQAAGPVEAIEAYWVWLTHPTLYLVLGAYTENRRAVRWNGFMWQDVQEETK